MAIGWGMVGGLVILLSSVLVRGLILLATQAAFGESAGAVTLKQFREYPMQTRIALVVGAMAVTEHAGMICPEPVMTAKEYVTALTHRTVNDSTPWIVLYFTIVDERRCGVPQREGEEGT